MADTNHIVSNGKKNRGGKFSSIQKLACIDEVNDMLRAGRTLASVARFIQEDRLEYTSASPGSLAARLGVYRRSMKPAELVAPRQPVAIERAQAKLDAGINVVTEIQRLYEIQLERIGGARDMEVKQEVMLKFLGAEISTAANLLKTHHDMTMDLGLNGGRSLGTLTIKPEVVEQVRGSHGHGAAKALTNQESSGKVLSIFNKLSRHASAQEVLDVDQEREGQEQVGQD